MLKYPHIWLDRRAKCLINLVGLLCTMSFAAGAALEVDPKMGQVVMEKNVDGRLEVFRVNSVGELQHRWQKEPSGEWSPWWGLGGSFLPGLAVAKRADGQLQVFAVDKT